MKCHSERNEEFRPDLSRWGRPAQSEIPFCARYDSPLQGRRLFGTSDLE